MLRERAACGCVINDKRSRKLRADGDPPAFGRKCGRIERSAGTKVLCQRSHCLCGRIAAEDRNKLPHGTVADDGQRHTIARQSHVIHVVEFMSDGCDHLAARGAQPSYLVVDDDQSVAVPREDRRGGDQLRPNRARASLCPWRCQRREPCYLGPPPPAGRRATRRGFEPRARRAGRGAPLRSSCCQTRSQRRNWAF